MIEAPRKTPVRHPDFHVTAGTVRDTTVPMFGANRDSEKFGWASDRNPATGTDVGTTCEVKVTATVLSPGNSGVV